MDDGSAVDPREASAGLGLLGALLLGLVGTFVYRIVAEKPIPRPTIEGAATIDPLSSDAAGSSAPEPFDAAPADNGTPPAEIPEAATDEPPVEASPEPRAERSAQPHFVAPGSRTNQ